MMESDLQQLSGAAIAALSTPPPPPPRSTGPTPVPESVTLTRLYEIGRAHSVKVRRSPKWKFQLAPDLVVQIQPLLPRVTRRRGRVVVREADSGPKFSGLAFVGEGKA